MYLLLWHFKDFDRCVCVYLFSIEHVGWETRGLGRDDIWLRRPWTTTSQLFRGRLTTVFTTDRQTCCARSALASRQPPVVSTCLTHVNPRTNSMVRGSGTRVAAASAACGYIEGDWNIATVVDVGQMSQISRRLRIYAPIWSLVPLLEIVHILVINYIFKYIYYKIKHYRLWIILS